jgi:predicted ATPase
VETAVIRALGLQPVSNTPVQDSIIAFLRDKTFLLILDNFEHVLDAALLVSALLPACPHLKIIATSREPLHLYGEQQVPVAPLGLPDLALSEMLPGEILAQLVPYPAVRLFIERARAVRPGFTLSAQNARPVVEICAQLDGLPLAIELAAARMKFWSPQVLLSELKNRPPFLVSQARDLPDRHKTLYGAIEWSYGLLTQVEQSLFAQLSVFAGSFTLETVRQVAVPLHPSSRCEQSVQEDVSGLLAALVEKNLVQIVSSGSSGQERFILLETIRTYALEKLEQSGASVNTHARHADFFIGMVHAAESQLRGPDVSAWLDLLDTEFANIRKAFSWSLNGGNIEAGLRAIPQLLFYWMLRGPFEEAYSWVNRGLALIEPPNSPGESSCPLETKAELLSFAGAVDWLRGDYARSYQRCLAAMHCGKPRATGLDWPETVFGYRWPVVGFTGVKSPGCIKHWASACCGNWAIAGTWHSICGAPAIPCVLRRNSRWPAPS